MTCVLIRGIGDIASAVAHRFFTAGVSVGLHTSSQPTDTRRGMAFTDAVFDGEATLEGVSAVRVDTLSTLPHLLTEQSAIPVVMMDITAVLHLLQPEVLIDARMRKRAYPEN